MAKVVRIIVHCTDEYVNSIRDKEYYRRFFFEVKGWKHYGYHVVVYPDGTWEELQPLPKVTADGGFITDATRAVGAVGYHWDSIHVAYVGGRVKGTDRREDTRTPEQKKTLRALIAIWKHDYHISEVVGHRDLPGVNKACPCFDAKTTYANA